MVVKRLAELYLAGSRGREVDTPPLQFDPELETPQGFAAAMLHRFRGGLSGHLRTGKWACRHGFRVHSLQKPIDSS
jgi:hypothetical protein